MTSIIPWRLWSLDLYKASGRALGRSIRWKGNRLGYIFTLGMWPLLKAVVISFFIAVVSMGELVAWVGTLLFWTAPREAYAHWTMRRSW